MIAHPLRAIFIHIPKTAGQSIEHVFLSHLGLDQNSRPALLLREKLGYEQGPPRLSHLTATEYVEYDYISQQKFIEYFSFSFVRNPWGRVRSFYHYLNFDQHFSFECFVLHELEKQMQSESYGWFLKPQVEFIYDKQNTLLVDFVGHFEQLQKGFDYISQQLGLQQVELPRTNTSSPSYSSDESGEGIQHYTIESANKVADIYRRDIELLGYNSPDSFVANETKNAKN